MSVEKVVAIAVLAASAMLFIKPLVPGVVPHPLLREVAQLSAPAQAAVCLLTGVSILAAWRLYQLLFGQLDSSSLLEEVGYYPENGRTKAQAANEVRRRRKLGDLPPVFPNGWYRVLDSVRLKKGEVKNVTVVGEQVAVFRGEDGEAHVLDAYCAHLGANLAVGGQVKGNCLECPFHGWQYDGSGKCVKIPYAEKVPEFASVRQWPSIEVNNHIMVWYHCDGEDPHWDVPELKEVTQGKWVYRGRSEHFVSAHAQEVAENGADLTHFSHLHLPGCITGISTRIMDSKFVRFFYHDFKVDWEVEPEPNKHCNRLSIVHRFILFGHHLSMLDLSFVARRVGPGQVYLSLDLGLFGSGTVIQSTTPIEPMLQQVTHTVYFQTYVLPLIPKLIVLLENEQFERDVMVWNNKTFLPKPLLTKSDAALGQHRRWYSQFYSKNSPRMKYQQENLEF